MGDTIKTAPYGTWQSPVTSEMVSGQSVVISEIVTDPKSGIIYYLEDRPAENGRSCIVAYDKNQIKDILPEEYNVRSRIHEYGGGAMAMGSDGTVIFTDMATSGVFALNYTGTSPAGVIPLVKAGPKLRFANFDMHPHDKKWILAVREDHRDGEDVDKIRNEVVVIDIESRTTRILIQGADFYAHPKFSPDGKKVTWVQWDHPDMVWTGSVLYTADWESGSVGKHIYVAGKARKESISQPRWSPDGTLWFASDRTGYWQLYYSKGGNSDVQYMKLKGMEDADCSRPEWLLGASTYIFLTESTIVAGFTKKASTRLIIIDKESGTYTEPEFPHLDGIFSDMIKRLSNTHFAMTGRTLTSPQALYLLNIEKPAYKFVITSSANPSIPTSIYSPPQHISFPRTHQREKGGEAEAHVIFTPPHNPEYRAPPDTLPPLIMSVHGGPTFHTPQTMILITQYWTSRGYAFGDLNFVGSSGYGRMFREALNGWLGIVDASDAVSCVEYLAKEALVDGRRVSIRGGSGGGYCTLQALWIYPGVFKAGVSEYGIGNIKLCHEQTHKQESRYLYGLIFGDRSPTPEEEDRIWKERSAVFHADKIRAPLLLLQGLDDKVVPPNQAEDMAKAIKENGGEVKTVFFEGEGHGFRKAFSRKKVVEEEEAWYTRFLLAK